MAFRKPNVYYGGKSFAPDVVNTTINTKVSSQGFQQVDSDGVIASKSGFGVVSKIYDRAKKRMVETYEVIDALPGYIMNEQVPGYVEQGTNLANIKLNKPTSTTKNADDTYNMVFSSVANVNIGDVIFNLASSTTGAPYEFASMIFDGSAGTNQLKLKIAGTPNTTKINTLVSAINAVVGKNATTNFTFKFNADGTTGTHTLAFSRPASPAPTTHMMTAAYDATNTEITLSYVYPSGVSQVTLDGAGTAGFQQNNNIHLLSGATDVTSTGGTTAQMTALRTAIAALDKSYQPDSDYAHREGVVKSINSTTNTLTVIPTSVQQTWAKGRDSDNYATETSGKAVLRGKIINHKTIADAPDSEFNL